MSVLLSTLYKKLPATARLDPSVGSTATALDGTGTLPVLSCDRVSIELLNHRGLLEKSSMTSSSTALAVI